MTHHDYLTAVTGALEAEVRGTGEYAPQPHPYVYASARQRCTRRMAFESLVPSLRPGFTTDTLARLGRGKARERDLNILLTKAGQRSNPPFEVEGSQQRVEIKGRNGQLLISGKIEGFFSFDRSQKIPYEIKAWAQHSVDRINSFQDILDNVWTWPAAFQLLAYLFATGYPVGFFVLDRPGLPKFIPVILEDWYSEMEEFLQQAEVVNKAYHDCDRTYGEVPKDPTEAMAYIDMVNEKGLFIPPFTTKISECKRCWCFGTTCNPPITSNGASVIEDEELETALSVEVDTKEAHSAYERAHNLVKERLRGVERAIVGPFVVAGSWGSMTKVDLPKELKAQYSKKDPKGRWLFDDIVDTREKPQKIDSVEP